MAWTLTDSMDDYLAQAGDYLRARPVEHTIELTATEALHDRGLSAYGDPAPVFGWWHSPAGPMTATLLHTPPYPALLSGEPAAAAPLAVELVARARALPGVNGPADGATAFAAAWEQHTGEPSTVRRRSRLFRLDELAFPEPMPPGQGRTAVEADADLLTDWWDAASGEIGERVNVARREVNDRLGFGGLTIWESGGVPVAFGARHRPAAGVVRVGPVYTLPEHRRRGYGAAVTAAVTRAALDDGASEVALFTDLANPTSNALYPRLGYRPVADRLMLAFGGASGS